MAVQGIQFRGVRAVCCGKSTEIDGIVEFDPARDPEDAPRLATLN